MRTLRDDSVSTRAALNRTQAVSILDDYRQALRAAGRGPQGDATARPQKATDAYALGITGVGPFLLASVGLDARGSDLTCLSMLARLGHDPWAEAARLSNVPKPAAIEELSADIGKMQLDASSAGNAAAAARLVELLPGRTPAATGPTNPRAGLRPTASFSFALVALGLGLILSASFSHHRQQAPVTSHATVVHQPK